MGTKHTSAVRPKKPRAPRKPLEGRRIWMTRGLRPEHHDRLRKIAAFLPNDPPGSATIQAAHDLALDAGLPLVEERVGVTLPPAA